MKAGLIRIAVAIGHALAAAVFWLLLLAVCGVTLLVVGVYALAGLGWALVASGIACVAVAGLILVGIARG